MKDYKQLIDFCTDYLHIVGANVIITYNDKILEKFSTDDYTLKALLHPTLLPHQYNLFIRKNAEKLIVCHEMIHLKQYEDNKLNINLENNSFTWNGKVYYSSFPYNERPWEIEAMEQQSKLLKAYKMAAKKLPLS